jgi:hypothetical protein
VRRRLVLRSVCVANVIAYLVERMKKRGDLGWDHQLAWTQRRAVCIAKKVALSSFGVHPVELVPGVVLWSSGSPTLHLDPEHALAELGFSTIIHIDGCVYVEPWG